MNSFEQSRGTFICRHDIPRIMSIAEFAKDGLKDQKYLQCHRLTLSFFLSRHTKNREHSGSFCCASRFLYAIVSSNTFFRYQFIETKSKNAQSNFPKIASSRDVARDSAQSAKVIFHSSVVYCMNTCEQQTCFSFCPPSFSFIELCTRRRR